MLDIKWLSENADAAKAAARKKRIDAGAAIDEAIELNERRRKVIKESEDIKRLKNEAGQAIARLQGDEKQARIAEMKRCGLREKTLETELAALEDEIQRRLLAIPNICAPEVPEGESDKDNVELRRVGSPPEFDFEPRDHLTLGEELDLVDIGRAARLSGSRQYVLKNELALMELGVLRLALDLLLAKGFVPMLVPTLVKRPAMEGTGYFPGGEEQAYACERDELFLIGTSEVPVTAFHAGEILQDAELPKLYAGYSVCYRREAGAAGKDTKGLYRIHQFQKVEQVIIGRNDEAESKRFHDLIVANAEAVLEALELPYRVVNVCGGDLGAGQVQKFDIETWMPSRGGYGETHSASRFHDYQARRLNLRYRDAGGKVRFCHTLNNTCIASPRILIPLLEVHQRADGSVRIPGALRPYLGGKAELRRR